MNQNVRSADAGACEMVLVKSDGRPLEAGEFVASVAASARSYKFTRGCPRRALGGHAILRFVFIFNNRAAILLTSNSESLTAT